MDRFKEPARADQHGPESGEDDRRNPILEAHPPPPDEVRRIGLFGS